MLVAEIFLISLIKLYGKHVVYSDDAGPSSSHETYNSVGIKYKLHMSFEKCIIEMAMEYVKNRTEDFDYCPQV